MAGPLIVTAMLAAAKEQVLNCSVVRLTWFVEFHFVPEAVVVGIVLPREDHLFALDGFRSTGRPPAPWA